MSKCRANNKCNKWPAAAKNYSMAICCKNIYVRIHFACVHHNLIFLPNFRINIYHRMKDIIINNNNSLYSL